MTFLFENRSCYEKMWKNIVETGQATGDNIIRRMRSACWLRGAAHTPSGFIIPVATEDDFLGEAVRIWGRLLIFMQWCDY